MIKNYVTVALRNLFRQKGYSIINIVGLSVGISVCLLIFFWVHDELQYDRFHENADRIYRLINERHSEDGYYLSVYTPPPLGEALEDNFPEVEKTLRLIRISDLLLSRDNKKFIEEHILFTGPAIFDFFDIPFTFGNPEAALLEPNTVVLTEEMARKYFGMENPVGETLTLQNQIEVQVTGVMKDMSDRFHIKADFFISFATLNLPQERLESWIWQQFYNYVMLPRNYDPSLLEHKLAEYYEQYVHPKTLLYGMWYKPHLQPVTDIYLRSAGFRFDLSNRGNITYVYAFSIIAIFILFIACINFMNLSTARSAGRAREVGVRKVLGANRSQLMIQFIGESVVTAIIAVVIAMGIVELVLPAFNNFSGKQLTLYPDTGLIGIPVILAFALIVGLLAGSYPAFFLSTFPTLGVIRGKGGTRKSGFPVLRKILIVFQFTVSIVLIVGTIVVFLQINYAQTKNLGFDKEQILYLPLRSNDLHQNYEAIKNGILQNPEIISATAAYGIPGGTVAGDAIRIAGEEHNLPVNMFVVDHDYLETLGIELIAGRDFSREFTTDAQSAFIINETMVRTFGWSSPREAVGKELEWDRWDGDGIKRGEVIGVVRDFHFKSMHEEINPVVMHIYPQVFSGFLVRVIPENITGTIQYLEEKWQSLTPEWPFEYTFLDQSFDQLYRAEQMAGKIFLLFSGLSVFIACLGLFGLSAYTAESRTKEIGIRKVLGAGVTSIVFLLSKEFTKWVLAANLIALPAAYYVMNRWLQNFAYRIEIGFEVLLLTAAIAFIIALFTVIYQSVRAALGNPVDALRYE